MDVSTDNYTPLQACSPLYFSYRVFVHSLPCSPPFSSAWASPLVVPWSMSRAFSGRSVEEFGITTQLGFSKVWLEVSPEARTVFDNFEAWQGCVEFQISPTGGRSVIHVYDDRWAEKLLPNVKRDGQVTDQLKEGNGKRKG